MRTIAQSLLLIFFLTSCNVLNFSEGELSTAVKLESSDVSNVQDIEATFTIRNGTDDPKTYAFTSGCQSAFKVLKEGVEVFDSYKGTGCTMAISSLTLQKRESKVITMQRPFDIELGPGNYIIKAFLIGYEDNVSASKEFVVAN
ncbi:MAG: hypothetical protein JXR20_09465 [Balneola sp.]